MTRKIVFFLLATVFISLCFLGINAAGTQPLLHTIAYRIKARTLTVEAGKYQIDGNPVEIGKTQNFNIPIANSLQIKGEKFVLNSADANHPFIRREPKAVLAGGVMPVTGVMVPGSLQVEKYLDDSQTKTLYKVGSDYFIDTPWSSIALKTGGKARENEVVLLHYQVRARRIDTICSDRKGALQLVRGTPTKFAPLQPTIPPTLLPLLNILSDSSKNELSYADVMPKAVFNIDRRNHKQAKISHENLRRFLDKLGAKQSRILVAFCGDSVSCGNFSSKADKAFPFLFMQKLKAKFPASQFTVINISVGGTNSSTMFPKLIKEVFPKHPDLVVVEFVNDLSLSATQIETNYSDLFARAKSLGIDLLVCLPHLPAPSFYGEKSWEAMHAKPYYSIVGELAKKNNIAVADIANRWLGVKGEGLDPLLLLEDGANHPNDRGHQIYAEELFRCIE